MTLLHVLRVFIGPDGRGGNPLGVFLRGADVPERWRLKTAQELGFSETAFVDEDGPDGQAVRIFTPGRELAFAGHPCVGLAWLLAEGGRPDVVLRPPAGPVPSRRDGERTYVQARPEWIHRIEVEQFDSASDVETAAPQPLGTPGRYLWAWMDEPAGTIRSRYFATDVGILEDEATGAAAVLMGGRLGRALVIRQGVGSEIVVAPQDDGTVEIGGRVEQVDVREFG